MRPRESKKEARRTKKRRRRTKSSTYSTSSPASMKTYPRVVLVVVLVNIVTSNQDVECLSRQRPLCILKRLHPYPIMANGAKTNCATPTTQTQPCALSWQTKPNLAHYPGKNEARAYRAIQTTQSQRCALSCQNKPDLERHPGKNQA